MVTIVFPGQGAQRKGMCAELFEQYQDICQTADDILGYSIKRLCLDDPDYCLNNTEFTQPALYTANALSYIDYLKKHPQPQTLAGHSLGEYNALLAAGVFDFATGLKLVKKRGELMSLASNGAMLAVLRTNEKDVKNILDKYQLNTIDIANYNSPSQLVLSGLSADIESARKILNQEKIFCVVLKVSGAFHSRYMQKAAQDYQKFLDQYTFNALSIPVIANVTGRPYQTEQIKKLLVDQLCGSVQWTQTVRYLMSINNDKDIIEIGPAQVLTKLNDEILENCAPLKVDQFQPKETSFPKSTSMGSPKFLEDHQVKYPYVAGSMCQGISSSTLVTTMARAGFLAFLGPHGLSINDAQELIISTTKALQEKHTFGVNIDYFFGEINKRQALIDLCIKHQVKVIEVSNYDHVSLELVKYRATGLQMVNDELYINHKIMVKTAISNTAQAFMQRPPQHLLEKLLKEQSITEEQYQLCHKIPMVDDVCVQGDGAWVTNQAITMVKLPEIIQLRQTISQKYTGLLKSISQIRIGSSGGLGTPMSIAAVFALGADFVVTGSINQCTVEANISDHAKFILEQIGSDDTVCVPSGQLFESGIKSQVLSKGSYFPARAQKLYDLYRLNQGLDDIEYKTKQQIEQHYFGRDCEGICRDVIAKALPQQKHDINHNEKLKMSKVFQWYFEHSQQLAIKGHEKQQHNYQIYCGPAMGAFNQWVQGGPYAKWQNRNVDKIAEHLMSSAQSLMKKTIEAT